MQLRLDPFILGKYLTCRRIEDREADIRSQTCFLSSSTDSAWSKPEIAFSSFALLIHATLYPGFCF